MEFLLIKGRIEQYKLSSLVKITLDYLNEIQRNESEKHPFWTLLVIIKWSFLYTNDNRFKKNANRHDLKYLLELVGQFESEYDGLSFKDHKSVQQSFKIIAYQQFSHQENFDNSFIHRQFILFDLFKTKFDIKTEFKKLTGIELIAFLNYMYFTFIYFDLEYLDKGYKYKGLLDQLFFNFFVEKFSEEELYQFLNLITIQNLAHFENLHKLKEERLQLYETNFFTTKPFILFKGQYRLPHKSMIAQSSKYFVYTYLKNQLPDIFPDDFGKRLERYLELGLKENKISYLNENHLKQKFRLKKVTDYYVEDNILIECKAVEMHPRSGTMRVSSILAKELNSSIIKAYKQLLSTAHDIDSGKQWFGIIVTYKEMYLGFGVDAWEEFLQTPIIEYASDSFINASILPPENLFFISIDYWDYMMQIIKEQKATLNQILLKGKEISLTTDPVKKRFLMDQVLREHFMIKSINLSYLNQGRQMVSFVTK